MVPALSRSLRSILQRESDREDAIAGTLAKLWEKRSSFQVRTEGAWWAYVFTIARRCALGMRAGESALELDDALTPDDDQAIHTYADLRHDRERLYRLADELWLGIGAGLDERDRRKRLLAAQLFYLHGQSVREIIAVLGGRSLDRGTLDEWLADEPTLRDLAFNELYLENEALTAHILKLGPAISLDELEASSGQEEPPGGWTWSEVKVIIRRFRNGLANDKLAQLFPDLTADEIALLLKRCAGLLPFTTRSQSLRKLLGNRRVNLSPLTEGGLWKRLVFQYHAECDLPQKQIFERTEPPAAVFGFHLTEGMLNVWLSNGRLCAQLAKYSEARNAV